MLTPSATDELATEATTVTVLGKDGPLATLSVYQKGDALARRGS